MVSGTTGLTLPPSMPNFDIWVMLAVSLACLPVFMTGREIARWEGAVFLFYYAAYVTYLSWRRRSTTHWKPSPAP